MKLYGIYRVGNHLTPTLYALTRDKSLAEEFMMYRDEKQFKEVKANYSKKDACYFLNEHANLLLTKVSFVTNGEFGSDKIEMVVTRKEEDVIILRGDEIILSELEKHVLYPEIFSQSLRKELDAVYYSTVEAYKNMDSLDEMPYYSGVSEAEMNTTKIASDQFMIFLKKYGWSLNYDKIKEMRKKA